ncbi:MULTISPECIES: hypothetical protein [Nocardia]|uniref:hypothetical protein n=1 Tax=Nocardia TaxID=1817 RepID=UPI00245710F2|nr:MULTISPECIES: hypothetical protein [Nocardia]
MRSALLAVAALALVGYGFWYMAGVHHPHRHDSTSGPDVTSVTEALEVPPMTAHTARPCYPLQGDY